GGVDMGAQAHLQRRDRQHTAELAGAQNADRGAGREDHAGPSTGGASCGRSATAAVRSARHASSRPASAGSERASTLAVSSPALIASVPTGTPAGICTIESRESSPPSALVGTGTPNVVKAAVMPGRCAAPPAPATITLNPSAFALLAKATSRSGVRCAETIRVSKATPSASSVSAARRITVQSDWLPMMTATGFDTPLTCDSMHGKRYP